MSLIVGQDLHLTGWQESAFATKPGSPTYLYLPVNSYDVKLVADRRNNRPIMGQRAQKHGKNYKGHVEGSISGALHGYWVSAYSHSLAYFVLRNGLGLSGDTGKNAPSFGCEFAQGPNVANMQHNGLMVNSFTLNGSADSGNIAYTSNVMGVNEAAVVTAQTVPNDMNKLVDFEYPDITLTVDDVEIDAQEFTLTNDFGLKQKWGVNRYPSSCYSTQTFGKFSLKVLKDSAAWDVLFRDIGTDSESEIVLTLMGLHNGTGATGDYTVITITMPRAQLINPEDAHSVDDATVQTLNFDLLKPDTSDRYLSFTEALDA